MAGGVSYGSSSPFVPAIPGIPGRQTKALSELPYDVHRKPVGIRR